MRRLPAPVPALAGALLAALAAGCASPAPAAGPRVSITASPAADVASPLASPVPGAGERLAELAGTAAKGIFAGRYALVAGDGTKATVTVSHLPTGYRVDIVAKDGVTDSLIGSSTGTVSCHTASGRTECFQAAAPGQPVPDLFDAGVQHVFTDHLARLASSVAEYEVDDSVPDVQPPPAPTAQCFSVTPLAGATEPVVPSGDYCLAMSGLPTLITYGSASLTLEQVLPAPADSVLSAPASPQPLPSSSS